jgi:hypothetical protein
VHCPPGAVSPRGRDADGRLERRYIDKIKAGRSFKGDPRACQLFEDRLDDGGHWLSFEDWSTQRRQNGEAASASLDVQP